MNNPERTTSLISDMDNLENAIVSLQEMLERVNGYVHKVINGEMDPNGTIGRFLMDTISVVPKIDKTEFEKMFNGHLQVRKSFVWLTLIIAIHLLNIFVFLFKGHANGRILG